MSRAIAFAAVVFLVAPRASAQEAAPYIAGRDALFARRFHEAVDLLEQARRQDDSAAVEYDLALALRELGRNAEAADAFERYLQLPRGDGPEVEPAVIRRNVEQLRGSLAVVTILVSPSAAVVTIDGRLVTSAANVPVRLDPGAHAIVVSLDGYETEHRDVRFGSGERATVSFRLMPTSPISSAVVRIDTPHEHHEQHEHRWVLPAAVTAGAVVVVAGAIIAGVLLSQPQHPSVVGVNPALGVAYETVR